MNIHERQDIGTNWAIVGTIFIVVFFGGLIGLCGWYFLPDLKQQAQKYERYDVPSDVVGPRPGAWTSQDLENYRREQRILLHSYAWANSTKTLATVPIERAIELAIKNKIPLKNGASDAP